MKSGPIKEAEPTPQLTHQSPSALEGERRPHRRQRVRVGGGVAPSDEAEGVEARRVLRWAQALVEERVRAGEEGNQTSELDGGLWKGKNRSEYCRGSNRFIDSFFQ